MLRPASTLELSHQGAATFANRDTGRMPELPTVGSYSEDLQAAPTRCFHSARYRQDPDSSLAQGHCMKALRAEKDYREVVIPSSHCDQGRMLFQSLRAHPNQVFVRSLFAAKEFNY